MSKRILSLLVLLVSFVANGAAAAEQEELTLEQRREAMQLMREVHQSLQAEQYEQARTASTRLLELLPEHQTIRYNHACVLARLEETDEALKMLHEAIEAGFDDVEHIRNDPDLQSLRKDEAFAAAIDKAKAKQAERLKPRVKVNGSRKIIDKRAKGGFDYRVHMSADATDAEPNRLVVWLHPSGASGNQVPERMAGAFVKCGFAVLVITEKDWRGWSGPDAQKLVEKVLPDAHALPGINARRPVLMGYSAGGQIALTLWHAGPETWGGLLITAAYPLKIENGGYTTLELPEDRDLSQCPIFALVGTEDGGMQLWKQAEPIWEKAGVPLTLHCVEGEGHACLYRHRKQEINDWLQTLTAPEQGQPE